MGHLPFLVVHGRAISALLVVSGGVLGVAVFVLMRRRFERGFVTYQRKKRIGAVGALAAGRATIRGQLRGRAATAVSHDGTTIRERSDALVLDVNGTPVEIQGDVDVAGGTRAKASWRGIPRGFVAKEARDAWRAFEVRDGDDVIATGEIANVAGTTDGDYREAAGGWVLKALPNETTVELFAATPAARAWALHPLVVAVLGLVFAGAAYAILWGIGAKLVENHPAVAAAFPHVRGDALEQLETVLEREPRTEQVLAQQLELAEMRHGCAARARIEGKEELYEAELADACGDADARIEALAHLGRYKEASAAATAQHASWPARNGTLALASGDWSAAAAAADDLVRRLRKDRPDLDPKPTELAIERAQCYAAWFRAKAGDVAAAAQLATLGPSNAGCAAARAMLLPPQQRGAALAVASRTNNDDQASVIRHLKRIAWAYGVVDDRYDLIMYDTIKIMLGSAREGDLAWLSPLAVSTRGSDAADLGSALIAAAVVDGVRGDFHAATAHLAEARKHAHSFASDIEGVGDAIALHLPDAIAFDRSEEFHHPATEDLVKLRDGEVPSGHALSEPDDTESAESVSRALAGDGGPLLHVIEKYDLIWDMEISTILAVLPHIRQHRGELAMALHRVHASLDRGIAQLPFTVLVDGAMHRDLARLAGDEASATHWQQLVDAQLPVLDDPDRVVALLLWQDD